MVVTAYVAKDIRPTLRGELHADSSGLGRPCKFKDLGDGGENIVGRYRTADTLECKLTHWLDGHRIFDRHEDARTDQDLTGLGFVAQTRCDIGHRADRSVVEAPFKADGAERGKSMRYTDAEADIVAQPTPLLGQALQSPRAFRAPSVPPGALGYLLGLGSLKTTITPSPAYRSSVPLYLMMISPMAAW